MNAVGRSAVCWPPAGDDGDKQNLLLADGTLLQIAAAVLAEEEQERAGALEDVIAGDTALAHWCIRRASLENRALTSAADAATWLTADRLLELLSESGAADDEADSLALLLFRRALSVRQKTDALERHWDQAFLREKLASLKEFTYGASHELNNPLFNISSRAQVLLRDETDPERRRKLSTIYSHAMRASEMINDIALAARPPTPDFAEVDLAEVVQEVVAELETYAQGQATQLVVEAIATSATIEGDHEQIALAVREIVINALESLKRSTRRGEIQVTIKDSDEGSVVVAISDNGPGMDARAKRHLFDPFFSGYESGRGLGFGLTKCWQIVEAHHGAIVVDSQPDRGTTFTIRLPQMQPASPARQGETRG